MSVVFAIEALEKKMSVARDEHVDGEKAFTCIAVDLRANHGRSNERRCLSCDNI